MGAGPEAFVDGLSAMIAEEKERLKAELAAGEREAPGLAWPTSSACSRSCASRSPSCAGRIESMQASLDALGPTRPE